MLRLNGWRDDTCKTINEDFLLTGPCALLPSWTNLNFEVFVFVFFFHICRQKTDGHCRRLPTGPFYTIEINTHIGASSYTKCKWSDVELRHILDGRYNERWFPHKMTRGYSCIWKKIVQCTSRPLPISLPFHLFDDAIEEKQSRFETNIGAYKSYKSLLASFVNVDGEVMCAVIQHLIIGT